MSHKILIVAGLVLATLGFGLMVLNIQSGNYLLAGINLLFLLVALVCVVWNHHMLYKNGGGWI